MEVRIGCLYTIPLRYEAVENYMFRRDSQQVLVVGL